MNRFALIAIALLVLAAPLDAAPVSTRSQPAALHAFHPAGACGTHLDAARELLRLSRAYSHGTPLPTPNSTDAGEIAVLEDDGTFFIASSGGQPLLDLAPVGRAFYRTHGDDYDFLAIYLATGLDDWLGSVGALASAFVVRNDIQGIGLSTYDLGDQFGAAPNLQMMMKMNGLHRYPDDPFEEFPNDSLNGVEVLAHEMAHRWVSYVNVDSVGNEVPALLGRGRAHWNYFLDSDASIMEGNDWSTVLADSFESVAVFDSFSALDQYLMGLRTKAETPPFFVINAPYAFDPPGVYVPFSIPYVGTTLRGTATPWSIDDIEAVHGPRVPASTMGPDTVRVGFVLVTAQGQAATVADLQKLEALRAAIPGWWNHATAGRGFVDTQLHSRAGDVHITHTPLPDTEDSLSARPIVARVEIAQAGIPIGVDPDSVKAFWRAGTVGTFAEIPMAPAGPDTFTAMLPPLPAGGSAQYYLYASSDSAGIDAFDPAAGPAAPHTYVAGADNTPPVVSHVPVFEQGEDRMPQTLLVIATDNVGVDSVWASWGTGGVLSSIELATPAGPDTFALTLGGGLNDGQSLEYVVHARDAAGNASSTPNVPAKLNVGRDWLLDFENGAEGLTTQADWVTYNDAWHLSSDDAAPSSPGTSWKCGSPDGLPYPAHLQSDLRLPWVPAAEPGMTLTFEHRYDLEESSDPGFAWDGAYVVAWTANTGWVTLTPMGGYSHQFKFGGGPFVQNAPCWSGNSGGWVSETFDLSMFAPDPVQIRFRMLADEFIGAEGWYVDRVRIDYPGANVSVGPPGATVALGPPWPNPARTTLRQSVQLRTRSSLSWELYDVAGRRAATLWTGESGPGPLELNGTIPPHVRSGLYFARLHADGIELSASRVIVLR